MLPDDTSMNFKLVQAFAVCLPMVMNCYAVFGIQERAIGAKTAQFVCGVSGFTFWIYVLCYDLVVTVIPVFLIFAAFAVYHLPFDTLVAGAFISCSVLLMLYLCAILPVTYLATLVFSAPHRFYVWMFLYLSGTGKLTNNTLQLLL